MRILIGPNSHGLEDVIPELSERYPDVEFAYCDDRSRLNEEIADADVYFGWLGRDTFLAAEDLKWIQSPSTGVDGFLKIPELKEGDVILTNARGTHGPCLAESVFGMLLAFTRGIREFILRQEEHDWSGRSLRGDLVELRGNTMGIVGFGSVGRAVAERANGFGMRILAVDVKPEGKPPYVESLEDIDRLETLLADSDYVVVTVPLTSETRGMISTAEFDQMKTSVILVGISRGGVIDEGALIDALATGSIKAAALDVFEQEPLPEDSPLWDIPNLLITPHAAGGSQYEADSLREIFVENVTRFVRGDFPLRNQVDKEAGY